MRGVLLDPVTGAPDGEVSVPPSDEIREWTAKIERERALWRNRKLLDLAAERDYANTTTTMRYLSAPAAAIGISRASSGGAAWSFSAYTVVAATNAITSTFYIAGLVCQLPAAPAVTTTYEFLLELATGATGSEVTIIQAPATLRNVTAVGYIPSTYIPFSEPKQVAANTQISFRFAYSLATTSVTINGVKFMYEIV